MVWPPAAVIRDLLDFWGSGGLQEISRPPGAPKRAKNAGLGGILGETTPDQIRSHAKCGPSEPCLGFHMSLGPEIWPFRAGWGPFRRLGTIFVGQGPSQKKFGPEKTLKLLFSVAVPTSPFASKTERLWPLVPPTLKRLNRFQASTGGTQNPCSAYLCS